MPRTKRRNVQKNQWQVQLQKPFQDWSDRLPATWATHWPIKEWPPKQPPTWGLVAAGWGLATMGLLFFMGTKFQASVSDRKSDCRQIVQSNVVLSRQQLAEVLAIPERSDQSKVKAIIAEPYCQLAELELRDGISAQREAYPLAFDPKTWLVLLYEGNEYAGYAFSFQQ